MISLDASILGGNLHAAAGLTPGAKPAYKLSGSFQKLNPALVFQLFGMKGSGGPIDGNGQIELSGYTEKDLTASAKGDLHFVWSHGALTSLTEDPVPAPLARFDRFTGEATIDKGALSLDKNQVQRGARKSTVEATVTFGIPAQVAFGAPPKSR